MDSRTCARLPGPAMRRVLSNLRLSLRDLLGDLLFVAGVTEPSLIAKDRFTIATFHRVLAEEELRAYHLPEIVVTEREFSWFLEFFGTHYTCGSLAGLHERWQGGERPAKPFLAITFDDGQRDNYARALPILERAGMKATFFVPTEAIDRDELLWHDCLGYAASSLLAKDRPRALALLGGSGSDHEILVAALERAKRLSQGARHQFVAEVEASTGGPIRPAWDGLMSWAHLRELVRSGHEVGSHSSTHPILPLVDDLRLEAEVGGSRARLTQELGVPCESFCYPNGDWDDWVVRSVRLAGYLRAVTTAWGPNGPAVDPFLLSRCDIDARRARSRSGALSASRQALRLSRLFPGPGRGRAYP